MWCAVLFSNVTPVVLGLGHEALLNITNETMKMASDIPTQPWGKTPYKEKTVHSRRHCKSFDLTE